MTILMMIWALGTVVVWRWLARDRSQGNVFARVFVSLTWPAVVLVSLAYLVLDTEQQKFERQAYLARLIDIGMIETEALRTAQQREFGFVGSVQLRNDLNALARGGHVIDTGAGWVSSETSTGETLQ